MKIEMGPNGVNFWSSEEQAMALSVLGHHAFTYLTSTQFAIDGIITAVSPDSGDLQTKLVDLVEGSNFSSWAYAIFWQTSRSKSGDYVLCWGDGHLKESDTGFGFDSESVKKTQNDRKRVLQKLHFLFGGSDDENYALRLDKVTDAEMFFLASMYFSFLRGRDAPGRVLHTNKHLWVSEPALKNPGSSEYCARAFLARSAGFKTIVLVPFEKGVLELGSTNHVQESPELLNSIKSVFEKRIEGNSPKIFGKNLNVGKYMTIAKKEDVNSSNGLSWNQNCKFGNAVLISNSLNHFQNQRQIDFRAGASSGGLISGIGGALECENSDIEASCKDESVANADERRPRKREVTAIGLTCACAGYFEQITKIHYRRWVFILVGFAFVISNLGLTKLIAVSVPILSAIYPPAIVVILLSFFWGLFRIPTRVIAPTAAVALLFGIIDAMKAADLARFLPTSLTNLPLSEQNLAWLFPALLIFIFAAIRDRMKK